MGTGILLILAALKLMTPAEKLPDVKIYVSPAGKDSNPGTLSRPFKTVQKAIEAARTVGLETDAPRTIEKADPKRVGLVSDRDVADFYAASKVICRGIEVWK